MIKKMFTLLIAVLFVFPFIAVADDFDDDFGGDDEEESEESESDEEDEAPAPAKAKVKNESDSDAAMRDLMGESEEKPAAKKQNASAAKAEEEAEEEGGEEASSLPKGLKPILLVKGGFSVLGQYKQYKEDGTTSKQNAMFGSVDEGIVGIEYQGAHVIAKGTLNLRTDNALVKYAVNNPLIESNLHSIQNGAANALYEIYGGIKFYDVFIKAGKLIPEYGLIDSWQELGMGFSTPFLTRSLIVVEGYIPETDAGLSLGYNGIIKNDHNVFVGLSLGTGSNKSEFWYSDKTLGIYGRVGYGYKEYIKAALAFQFRNDYYMDDQANHKKLSTIGIGVHLKAAVKGFEMPLTFDYNMNGMVNSAKNYGKATRNGMLLSLAPGYAYGLSRHVEWLDKVSIAFRYDLVMGIYASKETSDWFYLDAANFKKDKMYMRIGATANLFTKEFAGIRGMAGLTFLMQPKAKIAKGVYDHGFTTIVIQAGAEY